MMQGISGGMQGMPPPRQDAKMTTEQGEKLNTLLQNYDADALSDEDAKSLVSAIKELGIQPGRDLASALGEAGIDAKDLAEQAGIGKNERAGPPPPPPGGEGGAGKVDEGIVSLIEDAVATYDASEDEDTTLWSVLQPALEEAGYDTSQPIVDFYA